MAVTSPQSAQQSTAPIRIAFVMHVMQVAGAEMLVTEVIHRLGSAIAPVVICLDRVGELGERLIGEGVPVVALNRRPGLDWSVAGRLGAELKGHRVQVVHAHQYTPFFYSALARIVARAPMHLMFTEHGRHYPDVVSARRRLTNRYALSRLVDDINAVCRFSADSLAEKDGFARDRIEVIENGIDMPPLAPDDKTALRRQLGLEPERRYVICVARFHPVKDHAMLLTAFAAVARRIDDADLLLAGDGPLRSALLAQAEALGIAGRVHFLGVRNDVPQLLAASDVFALTSLSEAASLTLLEAMAAQLPVVVTDVGGNPEIVRANVEGALVPRGDAAAAATALVEVLSDPARARRMGDAGRARVQERYLLDRTVQAYYQRYRSAADSLARR